LRSSGGHDPDREKWEPAPRAATLQRAISLGEGGLKLRRGIDPFAVLSDQVLQTRDSFSFRDVELHGRLTDVEIDLTGAPPT
jgi:hypothetical protein